MKLPNWRRFIDPNAVLGGFCFGLWIMHVWPEYVWAGMFATALLYEIGKERK